MSEEKTYPKVETAEFYAREIGDFLSCDGLPFDVAVTACLLTASRYMKTARFNVDESADFFRTIFGASGAGE